MVCTPVQSFTCGNVPYVVRSRSAPQDGQVADRLEAELGIHQLRPVGGLGGEEDRRVAVRLGGGDGGEHDRLRIAAFAGVHAGADVLDLADPPVAEQATAGERLAVGGRGE